MRTIYFLLLIGSMVTCIYGQVKLAKNNANGQNKVIENTVKSKSSITKKKIALDPAKPTVYIDFVKLGDGEPRVEGESRERIYLKLVNNSIWSIYVPEVIYSTGAVRTVGFNYSFERERNAELIDDAVDPVEIPEGFKAGDCCSGNTELKSGGSVSFNIPAEDLTKNLKIRIDFDYDWELGSDAPEPIVQSPYSEIKASVFFTNSQLEEMLKTDVAKLKSR